MPTGSIFQPQYSYSQLPDPAAFGTGFVRVTDYEDALFYCDGKSWKPAVGSRALGFGYTVTNPRGLRRFRRALDDALMTPAKIYCVGDSVTFGIGANGTGTETDLQGHTNGWAGQLRTLFGLQYGAEGATINPTESSFVAAANIGAQQSTVGLAGLARYGNSTGPGTLTFTLPACTAFTIIYYENNGADGGSVTGGFSYAVDGGGATTVNYGGAAQSYLGVGVSGLSNAAHTVVITGVSANNFQICGIRYRGNTGVSVSRFGQPGWSTADMLGTGTANSGGLSNAYVTQRLLKAFSMQSPDLVIPSLGINDWAQQFSAGTTPAVYKANLQSICTQVVDNGGCVLLLSENYSNATQPANGSPQSAYFDVSDELARTNEHVAHMRVSDLLGSWQTASGASLMYDNSHPNRRGHGAIARLVHRVLTQHPIPE